MELTPNIDELLQIAEDMEREGKTFYASAAALADTQEAKKLFLDLAEWESKHLSIFEKMRQEHGRDLEEAIKLDPNGEESLYLQAMVEGKIFNKLKSPGDLVSECDGDKKSLLNFAIEREKDAVVFYTALGRMLDAFDAQEILAKIVGEEISHIRFLTEILHKSNATR